MAEPFLSEIRIMGFNFAPRGWAQCDGQILPINQNQALFSLLGTTYGGDGRTSFALPDLRGRTPIHTGSSNGGASFQEGQKGGEEAPTLGVAEMPQHTHDLHATNDTGTGTAPAGNVLAEASLPVYDAFSSGVAMGANSVTDAGGNQAHENMQPYLALNFCIALQGLFPSRN